MRVRIILSCPESDAGTDRPQKVFCSDKIRSGKEVNMKKFEVRSLLALILALVMVLAMTACAGGTDEPASEPVATDPVETDPTETDPIETDPTETDPVETDPPEVVDPVDTDDPDETDPKYDPIETDPIVTDPVETDPPETEPAHTHNYVKGNTVAATCQQEGYTEYTCSCGDTKKEDIKPKTDHSYKQTILSYASCTVDGEVVLSCIHCGTVNSVIEVTPATGHTYAKTEVEVVSPTHHKAIVERCECGEMLDSIEFTEEHTFVLDARVADIVAPSGDTEYGCEIYKCDCGYVKVVSANHPDGHYYYVDEGSGKYVCDCGEPLTEDFAEVYNGNKNAGVSLLPKN